MKITFLGAAKTVTGSCYLVETDKTAFLVDCGMFQGHADENANCAPFPIAFSSIDFLLLTHAHIDHSGRIPKIWLDGYRNPIYSTKATADLCSIMLPGLRPHPGAGRRVGEPQAGTRRQARGAAALHAPGRAGLPEAFQAAKVRHSLQPRAGRARNFPRRRAHTGFVGHRDLGDREWKRD